MRALVAFVVTLLPAPDRDGIRDLRFLLKIAKRRFHLRALDVREQTIRRRDARRRTVKQTQRRNEVLTMTINLKKYGPAHKWLKLEDFHGKPPRRERIGLVKPDTSGKYGERLVLTFEPSGQKLSLNKTSVGNLLRDFGENDDDWVGKLVEISAGEVDGPQGTTDAIVVHGVTDVPVDAAIAAKAAKAKPKAGGGAMDDEIPFAPEWR
jgi:hypothetical protein